VFPETIAKYYFVSANGTGEADEGHERVPEAIDSIGHDGNKISNVLCLFTLLLGVSHYIDLYELDMMLIKLRTYIISLMQCQVDILRYIYHIIKMCLLVIHYLLNRYE
jgi:hypothetical protein